MPLLSRTLLMQLPSKPRSFVEEAVQNCVQAQEVLAVTHCSRADAVNPAGIAFADAAIEVMEVTALERVRMATNQGNIAFWAQAHAKDVHDDFYAATNTSNSLCQREAESDLIVRSTMTTKMTMRGRSL
jgi:hypothetical protein